MYSTKPESVLSAVKKRNKIIKDEVSSILSSNTVNALRPLAVLSKAMNSNPKVSLEKFSSDGFTVSAQFMSLEPAELDLMNSHLKESGLPNLKINYTLGKNVLNIEFADRE